MPRLHKKVQFCVGVIVTERRISEYIIYALVIYSNICAGSR